MKIILQKIVVDESILHHSAIIATFSQEEYGEWNEMQYLGTEQQSLLKWLLLTYFFGVTLIDPRIEWLFIKLKILKRWNMGVPKNSWRHWENAWQSEIRINRSWLSKTQECWKTSMRIKFWIQVCKRFRNVEFSLIFSYPEDENSGFGRSTESIL